MKRILLLLSILVLTICSLQAQTTFTFIGGEGPTRTFWELEENWANNNYPGFTINANDTVIIAAGVTANIFNEILSVNGTLLINGNLVFNSSNANTLALNNGNTVAVGNQGLLGYIMNSTSNSGVQLIINNFNGATLTNNGTIRSFDQPGLGTRINQVNNATGATFINNNTIDLNFRALFDNSGVVTNTGAMELRSLTNGEQGNVTNSGSFTLRATQNPTLLINDGIIFNNSTFLIQEVPNEGGTAINNSNINNNAVFTIAGTGLDFTNSEDAVFNNTFNSTLNNGGLLTNTGFLSNIATFNNTHVFTSTGIFNTGLSFTNAETGTFTNKALWQNLDNGVITNNGTIINHYNIFNAGGATFTNNGQFTTTLDPALDLLTIEIINPGTIRNTGTASFSSTQFVNTGLIETTGGTFTMPSAIVDNTGTLNILGGSLTSSGFSQINNEIGATVLIGTNATYNQNATLTNAGVFTNNGTLINDDIPSVPTASGRINNNSNTFINNGTLINHFIITNGGTLTNSTTGTITNDAFIANLNTIDNQGNLEVVNFGTILRTTPIGQSFILNSGSVTVQDATLNLVHTEMVNSGSIILEGGPNNVEGRIFIAETIFSRLRNLTGGLITLNNLGEISIVREGLVINDGTVANNAGGSILIQGDMTDLSRLATFRNDRGIIENEGFIRISDFGTLTNFDQNPDPNTSASLFNTGTIEIETLSSLTNYGDLVNELSGMITINGNLINNTNTGFSLQNDGVINLQGVPNDHTLINGGLIVNNNAINLNSGNFNSTSTGNTLENTLTGTITINTRLINRDTVINNGLITNTNSFENLINSTFENNGDFLSTGTFTNIETAILTGSNSSHTGNVINEAVINPGNAVGTYSFANDITQQSTASLNIDIQDLATFDQLSSGGTATLQGALTLKTSPAYTPQIGDSFTILTANNVTGTFSELIFDTPGAFWDISYTPTSVIASVIAPCSSTTTYTATGWDNGIPDVNTTAIISEDYNTSTVGLGDITACELIINMGVTLTVTDSNFISIENNITINGSLNVANAGSVVQIDDDALTVNNGSITVTKTTPILDDRNFVAMSSPLTNEARDRVYGNSRAVFSIIPQNFVPFMIDFVEFPEFEFSENFLDDNNDYLLPVTGSTALPNAGIGQLIFPQPEPNVGDGAYTLTYTQDSMHPGTLNSGTITVPINYNGPATTNNYNLLGNPYASAIDVTAFINANDAVNEVYYWDHITMPSSDLPGFGTSNFSMNDISIRNAMMGIAAVNGGTEPGQFMASGQGFGIKADQAEMVAGTPVVFTNSIRVTGNNDGFRNAETQSGIDKLWLNLTTPAFEEAIAQTGIGFASEATPAIDKGYDSPRLGTFLSLFTTLDSGELLGIQAREPFDPAMEIALGFSTSIEAETQYTIGIDTLEGIAIENTPVFIIDHVLDTIVNLNEQSYTFVAQKGLHTDRFTIVFQDRDVLDTDEESFRESEINIYPNPSQGQVTLAYSGSVTLESGIITDMNGKVVKRIDLNNFNQSQQIDLFELARDLYFINIISQESTVTKKLIVR